MATAKEQIFISYQLRRSNTKIKGNNTQIRRRREKAPTINALRKSFQKTEFPICACICAPLWWCVWYLVNYSFTLRISNINTTAAILQSRQMTPLRSLQSALFLFALLRSSAFARSRRCLLRSRVRHMHGVVLGCWLMQLHV